MLVSMESLENWLCDEEFRASMMHVQGLQANARTADIQQNSGVEGVRLSHIPGPAHLVLSTESEEYSRCWRYYELG